jgi:hypothetical protein
LTNSTDRLKGFFRAFSNPRNHDAPPRVVLVPTLRTVPLSKMASKPRHFAFQTEPLFEAGMPRRTCIKFL